MLNGQFTCKNCGRTTFCNLEPFTKTYGSFVVTRKECAFCGYICYEKNPNGFKDLPSNIEKHVA